MPQKCVRTEHAHRATFPNVLVWPLLVCAKGIFEPGGDFSQTSEIKN